MDETLVFAYRAVGLPESRPIGFASKKVLTQIGQLWHGDGGVISWRLWLPQCSYLGFDSPISEYSGPGQDYSKHLLIGIDLVMWLSQTGLSNCIVTSVKLVWNSLI